MQNKRIKGLVDALKTGEVDDTLDEESEKNRIIQEGARISRELDRYDMPPPSIRVPGDTFEPHLRTDRDWTSVSIRHDGMLTISKVPTRSGPVFDRLSADDIRRCVDNGRKRLMEVEKSIDEAISMYSGDALAGVMEGKDKRNILNDIANAKVRELEGHFRFIKGLPDELSFGLAMSTDRFRLAMSYSFTISRVVISKDMVEPNTSRHGRRQDNPVLCDIAFLKDFPQIEEAVMLRAEKLKREIKYWLGGIA